MPTTSIPLLMRMNPIKPTDFADSMTSRIQSLNPGFHCGGAIRNGFIQYGAAYNDCVDLNSKGESTQLVIPAATGTGKSVSASLYLPLIAKMGMSGLLVVSEISVALETAEVINSLAGEEVAGAYYAISDKNPRHKLWHSIEDQPRILIITHAMCVQRSDSGKDIEMLRTFQGQQRNIVIIDERIDLIKRVSFGTDEIKDAVAFLERDSSLHRYVEILTTFNDVLFIAVANGTYSYDGKLVESYKVLIKDLSVLLSSLDAGYYDISQRLRGKKRNPESERAGIKDLLIRMLYVVGGRYTHTHEGSNVVCHREENLSGSFGSVVVLDATATVNPEYGFKDINDHDIKIFARIASRNYSNVILNICSLNGPKQSKSAIYSKPQRENKLPEIIRGYLKVIGSILMPGDKLLVVTYKDVVPLFNEHNPYMDQVKFIHWGSKDARGSNEYKDYNKALVLGWLRKPAHYYVSTVMAINQIEHYISTTGSVWSDANHLKDMLIIDDMIQFFNRVRCRTAIDDKGNCLPVELYCFTGGNTQMEELIRSSIESEMPNIVFNNWEPKELKALKQKTTINEERAENFIKWLRGKIEQYEEISLAELRREFWLEPCIVTRVIKSSFFKDLLDEENITMITARDKGNSVRFILPMCTA